MRYQILKYNELLSWHIVFLVPLPLIKKAKCHHNQYHTCAECCACPAADLRIACQRLQSMGSATQEVAALYTTLYRVNGEKSTWVQYEGNPSTRKHYSMALLKRICLHAEFMVHPDLFTWSGCTITVHGILHAVLLCGFL